MRKTVFEVGVALAAAAALTVIVITTEHLTPLLRWVILTIVAIVAFVGAWLAVRRVSPGRRSGTQLGNRNRLKGSMTVEKVLIKPVDADIQIGNENRTGGDLRISDVTVGDTGKPTE